MDEEAKKAYYAKEMRGAPLVSLLAFRCTYQLEVWLKSRGAIEGREYSAISRRLLDDEEKKEGFDPDGIL